MLRLVVCSKYLAIGWELPNTMVQSSKRETNKIKGERMFPGGVGGLSMGDWG